MGIDKKSFCWTSLCCEHVVESSLGLPRFNHSKVCRRNRQNKISTHTHAHTVGWHVILLCWVQSSDIFAQAWYHFYCFLHSWSIDFTELWCVVGGMSGESHRCACPPTLHACFFFWASRFSCSLVYLNGSYHMSSGTWCESWRLCS